MYCRACAGWHAYKDKQALALTFEKEGKANVMIWVCKGTGNHLKREILE